MYCLHRLVYICAYGHMSMFVHVLTKYCMCLYVCMYAFYIHLCIYAWVLLCVIYGFECMFIYVCTSLCRLFFECVCMFISIYAFLLTCTGACLCRSVHGHVFVSLHMCVFQFHQCIWSHMCLFREGLHYWIQFFWLRVYVSLCTGMNMGLPVCVYVCTCVLFYPCWILMCTHVCLSLHVCVSTCACFCVLKCVLMYIYRCYTQMYIYTSADK